MASKSKFDYEVEAFGKAFADKRDKRIALYGTGRMTATLLERLEGFNIVGLLDKDESAAGTLMYGKELLDRKKAESSADLIVINTSETYWNVIYERIADWGMPVYYRNGEPARRKKKNFEDNEYWQKNAEELRTLMAEVDVVSFDVFDTLIMRRVSDSMDVFRIVAGRLQEEYGAEAEGFVQYRKKAAGAAGGDATLDGIYAELRDLSGWSRELSDRAERLETETEMQLVTARPVIAGLYREAVRSRVVYLVSDMYFPRETIRDLLAAAGIQADVGRIIVSCEHKKSKRDGSLWEWYAGEIVRGRKALHIGDDDTGDVANPMRFGIGTYGIWSAGRLMENSCLRNLAASARSPLESAMCALLAARICGDPFCFHGTKGRLAFKDERGAGYVLLGPVIYAFCRWLSEKVRKDRVGQLLFFAREGWFLRRFFSEYCDAAGIRTDAELVYLETSRRAVMTASIRNEPDIAGIAGFPYKGGRKEFFHDRFGIDVPDAEQDVSFYTKEILAEAGRERRNYLRYLESLGIREDCAVVDSQLYGSTQFYLGKLMGRKLRGYYCCVCLDGSNRYLGGNLMEGCFCGKDGKESSIYKNAPFIESFLTAPNGMMECVNDDGTVRHSPDGENQRHFAVREEMAEGVLDFIRDAERVRQEAGIPRADISGWADGAFGTLMRGAFIPTQKMREGFYYDNDIAGRQETAIFG